ncbi:MAG: zinc ribbon domain-containing protein [Elusimicrobiota bacterium]|nr:zinc ribbon domain-containing protein [Elusimicrobiota bacterium]
MISRCPSCGTPAPDEARQCRGCGWDFVANKMGDKKPAAPAAPPAKAPPKPAVPPAAGFSLPAARGGAEPAPGAAAAPGAADENPFALPVARNLGPRPGESLFAPPPVPPEAKLPEAKPKPAPEPEPEAASEPPPQRPPRPSETPKKSPEPAEAPVEKDVEEPAEEPAEKPVEEPAEDDSAAALFLPSSTKEIIVEPSAKRAKAEAAALEKAAPAATAPATAADGVPKSSAGRPAAVYLAALAGAALGLFSVGAIYMMLRSEPTVAAPATRTSPFGKRAAGDSTMTPVLDDGEPASMAAEAPALPPSPPPVAVSDAPSPLSVPAPPRRRPIEPPSPGRSEAAPVDAPKAAVAPPPPAPSPAPAPTPAPAVVAAPVNPARATATFPKIHRPAPVAPPAAAPKPKTAAPKSAPGPQWVFEGTVYDLLTTRGAYGVRLVFIDADDNEVASVETAEDGRYRASMKAGPAGGYALRIVHDDYSGKHIDELDSTSSVRKADLEQRKFLMQAGARSLPWIGVAGSPVRRDMALVPNAAAE